jgi:hypothetical protein
MGGRLTLVVLVAAFAAACGAADLPVWLLPGRTRGRRRPEGGA